MLDHKRNLEALKKIKGWIEIAMLCEIDNDRLINPIIVNSMAQLHSNLKIWNNPEVINATD